MRARELVLYAQRLEMLASRKLGDENIEENKQLMKKFLTTILRVCMEI